MATVPPRPWMFPIFCLCLPSCHKNDCSSSGSHSEAQPCLVNMNLLLPLHVFLRGQKTSSETCLRFPLARAESHTCGLVAKKLGRKRG